MAAWSRAAFWLWAFRIKAVGQYLELHYGGTWSMVSELICIAILKFIRGRSVTLTSTFEESESRKKTHQDAAKPSDIYRHLLGRYQLADIDTAMRWLESCDYIRKCEWVHPALSWYDLTDKGREVADRGEVSDEEKRLLYPQEDPYAIFVAYQFNRDDTDLVTYIREEILLPHGFTMLDGRADGLEEFRASILEKIRRARFFLCLLTRCVELASGTFASSVWLYQETGVAVAYGKKPLLLVEEGLDSDYVGELQSIYEHIMFTRSNYPQNFKGISRRFLNDLDANLIPRPDRPIA
jgi:hypothetical protein